MSFTRLSYDNCACKESVSSFNETIESVNTLISSTFTQSLYAIEVAEFVLAAPSILMYTDDCPDQAERSYIKVVGAESVPTQLANEVELEFEDTQTKLLKEA